MSKTAGIKNRLLNILKYCTEKKWKFSEMYRDKKRIYDSILIVNIFLGVAMTTLPNINDTNKIPVVPKWSLTILGSCNAILASYIKFSSLDKQVHNLLQLVNSYKELIEDISYYASIVDNIDNNTETHILKNINIDYRKIIKDSPIIPKYINNRYEKYVQKYNLEVIPKEVNALLINHVESINNPTTIARVFQKSLKFKTNNKIITKKSKDDHDDNSSSNSCHSPRLNIYVKSGPSSLVESKSSIESRGI